LIENSLSGNQLVVFVGLSCLKHLYHALQGSSLLSSLRGKHEESSAGLRALALLGVGASGLLSFATIASADEAEHGLAAPDYPWPHAGIMSSYDHAS
jgi:ubiquinol-cytochrome c reductase cytochrome c1 subunit